jgi:hypothetical protein
MSRIYISIILESKLSPVKYSLDIVQCGSLSLSIFLAT